MEEEVVVKNVDSGVEKKTFLRWIGEISVDREAELHALFSIPASSAKERAMKQNIARWLSGVEVEELSVPDDEAAVAAPVVAPPSSSVSEEEDAAFRSEMKRRLAVFDPSSWPVLSDFVTKYNIVRLASPTLAALGPEAVSFLEFCGFRSEGPQYMKVENRERLTRAREVLEALRGPAVSSGSFVASFSADVMLQAHGSNVRASPLAFGVADSQGRRDAMEDEMCAEEDVFGLFDGHAGSNASKLCAGALHTVLRAHLKRNDDDWAKACSFCFAELHQHVLQFRLLSGTTALVAQVQEGRIRLAHAGDSRAVLVREHGTAARVTDDHKPENAEERARIVGMGGKVVKTFFSNVYRVNGELSVARAIGDAPYTQYGVTHVPTCSEMRRTDDMMFLILACDGIWDVLSDAVAGKSVFDWIVKDGLSMEAAAHALVELAYQKMSADNLSVLIVDLRKEQHNEYL